MTDILCRWLNEEVKLSLTVDQQSFDREFATGYLVGEVLQKHGLQSDFEQFSQSKTADSKLNNFTRIEPTLKLLEVPYDTNIARDVMNQKHGVATRLMYQLFIALGRKTKMNLTGVAMETMRPRGPVKLEGIESGMYKERLKHLTPRQVDLNFETLIERFQAKQKQQEELAFKAKFEEEEMYRKYRQAVRQRELEKARQARQRQLEIANKIRDATVKIPKPPESKRSGKSRQELKKLREAQDVKNQINVFEASLKTAVQSSGPSLSDVVFPSREVDTDVEVFLGGQRDTVGIKAQSSNDYLKTIKTRLVEDTGARKEREKRRRRVLIQQMKAHEAQEEAHREEMLVNRLMRQSQQERRIAVQLMQVRHEKDVIRQNRVFRERQFAERRLKDFEDALNREAEMCRQARIEYAAQLKHDQEVHDKIAAEAAESKYQKHYDACKEILLQVVDFSCKIGEYRELTEKKIPPKLLREWTSLFIAGAPLYPELLDNEGEDSGYDEVLEDEKQKLLDEGDFMEYKNLVGEWTPPEGAELPKKNPVLGHIIQRLFNIVNPPEPPPPPPEFPEFPIKACFLGKIFSGKSTVLQKLLAGHRLVRLCIDDLVEEAVEAHKQGEVVEEPDQDQIEESESALKKRVSMNDKVNVLGEGADPPVSSGDEVSPVAQGADVIPPEASVGAISDESKKSDDSIKPEESNKDMTAEGLEKKDSEVGEEIEKETSKKSLKEPESASKPKGRQPTGRAKLGNKAFQFLKKGKPVQDQLLVDIMVEAVRQVPDGTGWVMDGFPGTINQAKLLEKALTGYDATKEGKQVKEAKKPKKSRLVSDPHPQSEASAPKSGIDLVMLFDLPDEIVLKRAEGRTYDPMSAEEYHQELNPPPEGSYTGHGKQEKVVPVADPSNDKEQVQQRITGFVDGWPKLEKWYSKFAILSKTDVAKPLDEVYDEVSALLVETVTRIHAPPEEKSTEETPVAVEEPVSEPTPPEEPPVPESPPPSPSKTDSKSKGSKPGSPRSGKSGKKSGKKDRSPSPAASKKKDRSPSPSKSKKSTSPTSSRKGSPTRGKSPGRPASKGSSKGSKRAKSPKGKSELEPEVPEEPQLPPEPEPGSEEWVYVEQEMVNEMAVTLAKQWEGVEMTYISTSKNTFHLVREERELIYRYFYGTRKEFASFLKRPDEKQEHVLLWQKYYNDLAEDMRSDEEVKGELHQTVDDLCDRLFEICDNRKEMAERERQMIMTEGWLEDRLGLLTNHYISLMQVEVDRYQDTVRLLRDYYVAMEPGEPYRLYEKMPNEQLSEYARLPLVELPVTVRPQSASSKSAISEVDVEIKPEAKSPASGKKDRENTKTPDLSAENPDEHKSRIPLVPRRPKSGDAGGRDKKDKKGAQKKDKSDDKSETPVPPTDLEEKLIADAHSVALTIIDALAQIDQAEQEVETQRQAELDKEKEKEMAKKSGKDKKDKKGRKSPKSPSKSAPPPETPPPPPLEDMTEEEKLKRFFKEKSRKEFLGAVGAEDHGLKSRLELIKNHATAVLQELKGQSEETYKDMDEWLGTRFLQECESIKSMAVDMRQAIEHEEKVQEELMLDDKEFTVDFDTKTFRTPTPPMPPSPVELALTEQFSVQQIFSIFKQFQQSAPSGVISVKAFTDMFLDLSALTHGMEMLPDSWTSASGHQFVDICQLLSPDAEYIDWRTFLVAACQPLPLPSNHDLLQTLENFTFMDLSGTGVVDQEQFNQVELWFSGEPIDSEMSTVYDRLGHMKEIFFDIFADDEQDPPVLDYVNMLLYFCVHVNQMDGFLRALSVVCNQDMPRSIILPSESGMNFESSGNIQDSSSWATDMASVPEMNAMITLDDLMRVFHHGESQLGDTHRFSVTSDPLDTYSRERLAGVFVELGVDEFEPIPFYILYQHPIMQDCMHMCLRYKMADLQNVFKSSSHESFAE